MVPNAKIIAVHVATGAKFETVSGSDGQYTIPFLPPGAYRITAEIQGFKRYVRENFSVSTGERLGLDIRLEVGQVADSVTVSAEATLLETTRASAGQVISARQVENLPMNGRTPLVLAQVAMGVVPSSDPRFYRPFDNAGPSGFSMGGAPAQNNELLVDGAPDTTRNNRVAYNPPVDTVEEVKVQVFEPDAAYGHTGGGTVNVVMKGGTNSFHGTVYEFNQVSALAATTFFTNRAGQTKSVTRYNQYGANAGAPFIIPKLLNTTNRAFWYFAWEGIKDSFPEPITTTVPPEIFRNGDLSSLLAINSSYQIFDPASGVLEGSRIRRQAISGNRIDPSRISPIAREVLKFLPGPNQAGRNDQRDNYLSPSVRTDDFYSFLGRTDFTLSDKHKLFFNYRMNDRIEDRGNRFFNIATGNFLGRVNFGSMIDDVYTFNPTTVLNVRLNWTRFVESNARPSEGFDFTTLGLPSYLKPFSAKAVLPRFEFDTINDLGDSAGDVTPFDIYQIFANLVKIQGKHSFKFGTDLRMMRESSAGFGNASGRYEFNSNWTRGPLDNSTTAPAWQDFASFLLGQPSGGNWEINAFRTNQTKYYALFVHDDWRAKPNLTFNLGLRVEQDLSLIERHNRSIVGFDPTPPSPISAAARAAYARAPIPQVPVDQFLVNGGLLFASDSNRGAYDTRGPYWSPRFGFAWTPTAMGGKTVIRGGMGVFFFALGVPPVIQSGFSQQTLLVDSLNSRLTSAATLANPFPNGIQLPTGSALGLGTFLGRGISAYNTNPQNPYSIRWNFSIQRELSRNMVFEVGYTANHAVHLTFNRNVDFVPAQYLSTRLTRDQATIDSLSALVTNPFAGLIPGVGLNGATVNRQGLLVPFPHFGVNGVTVNGDNAGSSYFHSMAVRIEKRFSSGFNFLTNFTYSKLMDRTRLLNTSDILPEKRISPDDRPLRTVVSASYELPFGKGKRFDSNNGALNRLIGGWVVNGIHTWQIGNALNWEDQNAIYYGGDLKLDPRNVDASFDVTRFERATGLQLGSNIRFFPSRFGNLRADGVNNIDLSVLKNTSITERVNFQLRFEAFNGFNRVQFSEPNRGPTASNFGTITGQSNLPRAIQIGARLVW